MHDAALPMQGSHPAVTSNRNIGYPISKLMIKLTRPQAEVTELEAACYMKDLQRMSWWHRKGSGLQPGRQLLQLLQLLLH